MVVVSDDRALNTLYVAILLAAIENTEHCECVSLKHSSEQGRCTGLRR